ncbi:Major Facilitator Superfamily protein [Pseudonocardia thermophila]|uniref:Major Facilitator Superfamily protein n=1 Tax=Pseudonocardia thermophila TaxID=1848 RepID=A0A1M7B478_PSETH|nr:MFS transporter [Pseudonocardia thermophila]SHL49780.1 Major Facilitator Superfamily protein [Pseudonocardia thermophila]
MPPSTIRRPRLVITVLAASGLVVSLMHTLVVPLLPRFPQLLNTTAATATWLVTATLIAGAVAAPLLGRLGDMYGKRRMLLVSLGLITAGSALGAVAHDIGTLIVARSLQGAALGVVPLGISIMRDVLPPGRVGAGIALMSSSLGIGGAIGLPVTGVIAQVSDWRWLFAGAAALALLLVVLVARLVPESVPGTGGRFDLLGGIGLAAALTCLLLAISKGSEWGWTSAVVLGLFGAAIVLFTLWGKREWRIPEPLVDLRVTSRPAVLWTNVATVLIGFSMFAGFLVTTQVLQAPTSSGYGFGLSLVAAGLVLLPNGAVMTVLSPISARISRRRGARTTVQLGIALLAAGNIGMAFLPHSLPLLILAMVVTSTGATLAYSTLPLIIMSAVPPTETASANSLNALARMLGTSSCSAFAAAVCSALVIQVDGRVLPSAGAYAVVYGGAAVAAGFAAALVRRTSAGRVPADARTAQPAQSVTA